MDYKPEDNTAVNSKKIMASSGREEVILEKSRKTTKDRSTVQR